MASAEPGGPAPSGLRLLVLSDLHCEGTAWRPPRPLPPHDVAVLAGDVSAPIAASLALIAEERAASGGLADEVVLVPGNHEYYGADRPAALAGARVEAARLGIRLLDGDEAVIGGVRFLGATLWTDYALYGNAEAAMVLAALSINDHRLVREGEARFEPEHARALHRVQVAWLAERLGRPHPGPTVVVTHHGPGPRSVHRRYRGDPVNAAFASDLTGLVRDRGPDLWIHGHTHDSFDYREGRTRVLCNPKGYGPSPGRGIENARFRPGLVVTLPQA